MATKKPVVVFRLAKLVVVFSLATSAVVSACVSDFRTSELILSRILYESLEPNDVVLADQAYGNYLDLALVQQQDADGIFRKHYARKTDFRRGKRLGKGDHLVTWLKPKVRPSHMDEEVFAAIPRFVRPDTSSNNGLFQTGHYLLPLSIEY